MIWQQPITHHVTWAKPSRGLLKFNIDGAAKGNLGKAVGGGILRDYQGKMVVAFYMCFEDGTNMKIECRAAIEALLICKQMEVKKIILEIDSHVLMQMLKANKCNQWRLKQWWKSIQHEHHRISQVMHVYKEGNRIIDRLVNVAIDRGEDRVIKNWTDLPLEAKGAIMLEQWGMSYLKSKRPR